MYSQYMSFCYMCNLCDVMVHSAIHESYVVYWSGGYSTHFLLSIGREMYPQYMCILFYVKLIWCNNISIDLLSIGVG